MTIESSKIDKTIAMLTLSGRLDTANAPMLERKINQWGNEINELVLDFADLEYISSMGLRLLLQTHKSMKEKNKRLMIKNMRDSVREVFEMTGFLKLMVQEEKFVVIRKNEDGCIVLSFNGEMKPENVSMVKNELLEIKEHESVIPSDEKVKIILDMGKLTFASVQALKGLNSAISETAWKDRELHIRNVAENLHDDFIKEGLTIS